MYIGLVHLYRRYGDRQGAVMRLFSRNAYTAYLIREVLIVTLAYVARDLMLYPLLKWVLVAPATLPLCSGLSSLIRKPPYAVRVLWTLVRGKE